MKTENGNKRTKRKEIQFNEAEYAVVEQKANAARLSVAAFIREVALGKELSAALTIEESERMKRTANISYKMQVNLNQIARLANIHGLPFVTDASENTSTVPTNISRLVHGMKWIYLPMNPSKSSRNNLPQKYVNFKRRTRNYRKRRPTITFIPPKVNAFSANGTTAGFIQTTEASFGISKLPTIRLIHFRLKLVGCILTMRFRYGMCMCIGGRTVINRTRVNRMLESENPTSYYT